MPTDREKIYDLDNIICLGDEENTHFSKLVVGWLADIVGPVTMPIFCVALFKKFTIAL